MVTVLCLCPVDVLDVAWSPHDRWLASCSIDNTIVIWNAHKFPGLLLLTAEIYYPCSMLVVVLFPRVLWIIDLGISCDVFNAFSDCYLE